MTERHLKTALVPLLILAAVLFTAIIVLDCKC